MVGENHPWAAYVRRKVSYAQKLWLETKIFSDETTIFDDITTCNKDDQCLGIIVQLPLPKYLATQKKAILDAVTPYKDVDCLWERAIELSLVGNWKIPIAPATPEAVLQIMKHYHLYDTIADKKIAILGEGDLVGRALAILLEKTWAQVQTFNEFSDQNQMRSICQSADIIIAATGKIHLVDHTFIGDRRDQVIIDVGRGMLDGKPVWDVNFDDVVGRVAAITPIPWWVWPVTVASLFWNLVILST